jgi:hypothetical protein
MTELDGVVVSMDGVDDSDVLSVSQLQQRSWDRDDIPQRLDDIQQAHNNIESNIQDIISDLEDTKTLEKLKDEYEGFYDQVGTDTRDNAKAHPSEVVKELQKRQDLMRRLAVWHSRSKELNRFARNVVGSKYGKLLEEYRTAQTYDTLEEVLEDKAEHYAKQEVNSLKAEMDSNIKQLEKLLQVVREQEKNHLEINKELAAQANGVDESSIDGLVDEMKNFLEDFVDEKGTVVLDDEELEKSRKVKERESARESAVSDQVSEALDDEDGEMSVRDEIVSDWDDLQTMSKSDIAELYDVDEDLVDTVIDEENLNHAGD